MTCSQLPHLVERLVRLPCSFVTLKRQLELLRQRLDRRLALKAVKKPGRLDVDPIRHRVNVYRARRGSLRDAWPPTHSCECASPAET